MYHACGIGQKLYKDWPRVAFGSGLDKYQRKRLQGGQLVTQLTCLTNQVLYHCIGDVRVDPLEGNDLGLGCSLVMKCDEMKSLK